MILNEQIENSDDSHNTEGTINAIHVYVLKNSALQSEVILGSAHSDAHKGSWSLHDGGQARACSARAVRACSQKP